MTVQSMTAQLKARLDNERKGKVGKPVKAIRIMDPTDSIKLAEISLSYNVATGKATLAITGLSDNLEAIILSNKNRHKVEIDRDDLETGVITHFQPLEA